MKRSEYKILKKRIRNLVVFGILLICAIIAYKLYPQSKSEKIISAEISYIDSATKENVNCTINSNDYDNGYYFVLPENVNGFQVKSFYKEGSKEEKYNPGDRYYFSENETKGEQTLLNVEYKTKEKDDKTLYYKILQTNIEQADIKIEGFMPKEADVIVKSVDFKKIEKKIKNTDDSLSLNLAYDIKVLYGNNKYEPSDFDENVKITFLGLADNSNPIGLKVLHIDDNEKIEEITAVSIEDEDFSFNTESFSVFAIVSPSVHYSQSSSSWNGSVASSFAFGDGSRNNPYLISNGEELAYLASQVNNGQAYSGRYFKLVSNINLNNNAWIPIGTAARSFSGVFDGQGFTISNAIITANGNNNQMYAYGIFGSTIGNSSNTAIIRNLVLDNVRINISFPGNEISNNMGYKIGTVVGAMYRFSRVENVISKNSTITNNNTWTTVSNNARPSLFVGGLVGETAYSSGSSTTQVTNGKFVINNCFSDVDINITISPNNTESVCRLLAGGILGRDSWSTTWPTSCLYTGTIGNSNSNMLMGPIMGGQTDRDYDLIGDISLITLIWELDPNLTMDCYYTNYTVRNKSYNSTWTTGATPADTTYRNSNGPWWYDYLAGVNKGRYTNQLSTTMLNMFNANANNSNLQNWIYSNGTFDLQKGLDLTITETSNNLYTFTVTPTSTVSNPTYTYRWYINDTLDSSNTTNSATFEPSFSTGRTIQVLVSDGTYVSVAKFTLDRLTLGLTITQNNGTLTGNFTGTGADLADWDRYTKNWTEIDVVEGDLNQSLGSERTLSNLILYHEYRLQLTNGYEGAETLTATFVYGNRNIVYVNNVGYTINGNNYVGNDGNNGATPQTAVKNMPRAYQLLNGNGTRDSNIVVVMGNYTATDFLDVRGGNANSYNTCANNYSKAALITGKFRGNVYNGNIAFQCEDNPYNGKYIFADTRFEYITFNGNNGRTFFYLQGHDITMGAGIVMSNYGNIDASDFGQIKGLGTPNFNMFCGFHNYNYSSIPQASKVCNVIIRSGTFRKSCNWRT